MRIGIDTVARVLPDIFSGSKVTTCAVPVEFTGKNGFQGLYFAVQSVGYGIFKIMFPDDRLPKDAGKKAGCHRKDQTDHDHEDRQPQILVFHHC